MEDGSVLTNSFNKNDVNDESKEVMKLQWHHGNRA